MFLDVFKSDSYQGRIFRCHGCDCPSKMVKGRTVNDDVPLPKGWVSKTELIRDKRGVYRRKSGFVINYYCGYCHNLGLNGEQVAQVLKRLAPKPKKRVKSEQVQAVHPG